MDFFDSVNIKSNELKIYKLYPNGSKEQVSLDILDTKVEPKENNQDNNNNNNNQTNYKWDLT